MVSANGLSAEAVRSSAEANGLSAVADGLSAVAFGSSAKAVESCAVAVGLSAVANGVSAKAVGGLNVPKTAKNGLFLPFLSEFGCQALGMTLYVTQNAPTKMPIMS